MISDNHIRFAETPGASFQDMGFKPKAFLVSERFLYLPQVVLHYRKHANNSDKNNNKVFAVCDAHDDTDKWLKDNRPDLAHLNKIMNQCRFANYIWNMNRLSGEPQKEFCKRFSSEFRKYYESGALEKKYFDGKSWLKLLCIIYPHNIFYPIMRMFTVILSPIYKTRIRDGYKVGYLFNKFIITKVKL